MTRAAPTTPTVQEATEQAQQAPPNQDLERLLQRPIAVPVIEGRFCPDSLEGYQRLARAYILSDLVPFTFKGTGNNKRNEQQLLACVTLVLAAGMGSLKLTPEQALSSLMVVNNRTALFGDALPALIRRSGLCLGIDERIIGEGDNRVAVCKITRLHKLPDGTTERETVERRFSVADAKKAKLWQKRGYEGKDTPWITHEERMLQMRARGFAARDGWADVLMGMGVVEELQDIEPQPENGHDKAAAAQEAIEALKSNGHAPTTAPERPRTQPPAQSPAEPPAAQDASQGLASGQDNDQTSQESGDDASMEDAPEGNESQVTQGTDAEQPQAPAPKPPKGSKPKGIGHADAQPPAGMFEQPQTAKPSPTRPWHR